MANRFEASTDTAKLLNELKSVVAEAQAILEASADDMSEAGREARSKLSAALEGAKSTYQSLQEKALAGAKKTDTLIRENPYQSLGLAFGLGLLVGFLVTRNKS